MICRSLLVALAPFIAVTGVVCAQSPGSTVPTSPPLRDPAALADAARNLLAQSINASEEWVSWRRCAPLL
jgi:hypothetical protein